jgi:chromosome segregation ATPase
LLAAGAPTESAAESAKRLRLEAEWQELREREENLRAYEAQLRAMQADIDGRREPATTTSISPFPAGKLSLQAAWDKLIRARELLDSEQAHFRDDRLAMKAEMADFARRLANLAAREESVLVREQALAAAEAGGRSGKPMPGERPMSLMTRLTRNPFDFARSVFRSRK